MRFRLVDRPAHRSPILLLALATTVLLAACAAPAATPTSPAATPTLAPTTPTTMPSPSPATPTVAVATPTTVAATPTTAVGTPTSAPGTATPAGTAVSPVQSVPGGTPTAGVVAMQRFNCGACHTIPGVPGASGTSAPSLAGWATHTTILGKVPNTPDNLIHYIENPQAVVPSSTMPNLQVPEPDARNMAAFLFTLK